MTMNIEGKYGTATVHTDNIDETTQTQVRALMDSPVAEGSSVHIMPDCHAGAGCVIGTTMTITDKVCPNLVGVDIGCGVLVTELTEPVTDFEKFDRAVRTVPSGFSVNTWGQARYYWESCLEDDPKCWMDRLTSEFRKEMQRPEHLIRSLGSLGGGNHFIEIDQDDDGKQYLIIHSGSRNLGTQVADYYQKLAIMRNRSEGIDVPDDLAYLDEDGMEDYLHDMRLCQEFAEANRGMMAKNILDEYFGHYSPSSTCKSWESVHNYINFDDHVLRKGAIAAHKDQNCIIPMNMRDGSLICVGRGDEGWNQSAPHGAGRIYSRSQARKNISLEEYQKSMEGIYTTCVSESTIDEAPMAYKPMEEIMRNIDGMNVDIVKRIRPVYNFKADAPVWFNKKKVAE